MRRFLRPSLLLLLVGLSSGGCSASCERVCDKLLECGEEGALETDRFSEVECVESCDRQGEVFQGWEDQAELEVAWDDHRSCLLDNECDAIADGACYDDRFFVVGE